MRAASAVLILAMNGEVAAAALISSAEPGLVVPIPTLPAATTVRTVDPAEEIVNLLLDVIPMS